DEALCAEEEFELVVQVNGKVRDRLMLPVGIEEDRLRQLVLTRPRVQELLDGGAPSKMVYIPGRVFSIVK
ncbi:MAG TPA: hypothetical protein VG245_03970, partial [Candidatus Dormibacteraeota bacterium]|nr:hypothetical protein [Candidatus Dormibacteraeota bacterium]